MQIKLIVGLGNPGKEYERTRHNAGFLFVDAITKYFKKLPEAGFKAEKSQTFMNKSGAAVLAMAKKFKVKPENILIAHDDIDILSDEFKFSFGRSSAGHKGVESIIMALKTKNFWRLRIGIGPCGTKKIKADKIILKKFTADELEELDKTMKRAISQLADSSLSRHN